MAAEISQLVIGVSRESGKPLENRCLTSCPVITIIAILAIGLLISGGELYYFKCVNVLTGGSLMGAGGLLLITAIVISTVRACRSQEPQLYTQQTQLQQQDIPQPLQVSQETSTLAQGHQPSTSTQDTRSQESSFDTRFRELIEKPADIKNMDIKSWRQFIADFACHIKNKNLSLNEIVTKYTPILKNVCSSEEFFKDVGNVRVILSIFKKDNISEHDILVQSDFLRYFLTTFCNENLTQNHFDILEAVFEGYGHHVDQSWIPVILKEVSPFFCQRCAKKQEVIASMKGSTVSTRESTTSRKGSTASMIESTAPRKGSKGFFGAFAKALVTEMKGDIKENWSPDQQQQDILTWIVRHKYFYLGNDQNLTETFDFLVTLQIPILEKLLKEIEPKNLNSVIYYILVKYDKENEQVAVWSQVLNLIYKLNLRSGSVLQNLAQSLFFTLFITCVVNDCSKGKGLNWKPTKLQFGVLKGIVARALSSLIFSSQPSPFDKLLTMDVEDLKTLLSESESTVFKAIFLRTLSACERGDPPAERWSMVLNLLWPMLLTEERKQILPQLQDDDFGQFFSCIANEFTKEKQEDWTPDDKQQEILQYFFSHESQFDLDKPNQAAAFAKLMTIKAESIESLFFSAEINLSLILDHIMGPYLNPQSTQKVLGNKVLNVLFAMRLLKEGERIFGALTQTFTSFFRAFTTKFTQKGSEGYTFDASQQGILQWILSCAHSLPSKELNTLFFHVVDRFTQGQEPGWKPSDTQQALLMAFCSHNNISFNRSKETFYKLFHIDSTILKNLLSNVEEGAFGQLESDILNLSYCGTQKQQDLCCPVVMLICAIYQEGKRSLAKSRPSYKQYRQIEAEIMGKEGERTPYEQAILQLTSKHLAFSTPNSPPNSPTKKQ